MRCRLLPRPFRRRTCVTACFLLVIHLVLPPGHPPASTWLFLLQGKRYEQEKLLTQSNSLYVGNLSFYTTEEQVGRLFRHGYEMHSPKSSSRHLPFRSRFIHPSIHLFFIQQVYELFAKSGDVKRIIIGLDKVKKTACGFCFVEYPFNTYPSFKSHMANYLYMSSLIVLPVLAPYHRTPKRKVSR